MKIAVPSENGKVFQHFGRTGFFTYYDVTDGKVSPEGTFSTEGTSHEALADLLASAHVDVVICGGLGAGMIHALQSYGIRVVPGAEGSTDDAVAAFLSGALTASDVPNCDRHGKAHDGGDEEAAEGAHACGGEEEAEGAHACGGEEEAEGAHACGGCGGGCGGCCGHHTMPEVTGKNVGKTVRVHYEGTFNDGTVFDSSWERNAPLEFICGAGQMIHGFDQAVADMEQGQTVQIHLMPEEAYGMPDPGAVLTFEISDLPGSENLKPGQRVHLETDQGQVVPVRVTAVSDHEITLDANHEMAGKELNFRIELLEVV